MTANLSARLRRAVFLATALATAAAHAQPADAAVDNPYGLAALWLQSDLVARAVLLVLAAMSVGSWYVIVTKLI